MKKVKAEAVNVEEERSLVVSFPEQAVTIRVSNESERAQAGEFLKRCRQAKERWEGKIDPIANASYKAWKGALALKKELTAYIERAENIVMPAIADYEEEKEKARLRLEEALRKQAEEERKAKGEPDEPFFEFEELVPIVVPKETVKDGISVIKRWHYRVLNIDLVPRMYLIVDDKTVGGIVRTLKDKTRIDGIEVYSENTVTVKVAVDKESQLRRE